MAFPISLDDFTPKTDNSNDVMAIDVNELQTAIEALEAKVGINASAVTTSLDYLIKSASDPGHTHTAYSLTSHNHSGVYEPANPNLLDTGDIGVTIAAYSHNHAGVYEPADASILKSAAIGVSIQAYRTIKSGTFASGSNTYVMTDADVNANTIVDLYAQSAPIGGWTVSSGAGSFTITSTKTETSNVAFKYILNK